MLDDRQLFTSGEVQRLIGIPHQHLAYWDRSSLVCPTGRAAHGRGSRRLYTVLDVLQLKLIRRLRSAGLPLQRIRKALEVLSQLADEPAPLRELDVLTDGKNIVVQRSNEQLLNPSTRQYVLRLPLAMLLAEIAADTEGTDSLDTVTKLPVNPVQAVSR